MVDLYHTSMATYLIETVPANNVGTSFMASPVKSEIDRSDSYPHSSVKCSCEDDECLHK